MPAFISKKKSTLTMKVKIEGNHGRKAGSKDNVLRRGLGRKPHP